VNESRPRAFDAGRYIYIQDLATGKYWIGNPQPGDGSLYKGYHCRHSQGWSELKAERYGIEFTYRFFIPLKGTCELWTVSVKNVSGKKRRLALVPAVELPTRSAYLSARGHFSPALQAVRCVQPGDGMWKRLTTHLFFGLDRKVVAWDTSRHDFWGVRGDPRRPIALETGLKNSNADTEWMVAAMETRTVLAPGQSFTFNGILGYAEKDSEAAVLLRRFRKPGAVDKALSEVIADWDRKFLCGSCELPDKDVARFLSVWGKSAMTQVTHGSRGKTIGYRDTVQDLRGYLLVDPSPVKEKMLWLISWIRRDGSTLRGIDPWGGHHDTNDYRDNPVWMTELVNAYVRETGDFAVLDKVVPYLDGGKGSVWDHLVKIVERLVNLRGKHNLVLVGGGDWNDALGPFGEKGKGESAWLSMLVVRGLRMLVELADATGRKNDARKMSKWRKSLVDAFNRNAWDGEWYVYGWDDKGIPIGAKRSPEGKIHANVQAWALMERVVPLSREKMVWASIRKYLETDAGLITCWPAYVKTQPTGARIMDINPGWIENAAIYCHGTAFHMAACVAAGKGDDALRALQCYLPTNPRNPRCDMEPFAVTNFFVGPDSRHFGRAGYSWFTGSVSWFLFVGWEGLLGIRPEFDGLRVAPCVPRSWTRWNVRRVWRGAAYNFEFSKNRGSVGSRVVRLVVDGRKQPSDLIPAFGKGEHNVEVRLG
jgi:cellobiose phosphorylase